MSERVLEADAIGKSYGSIFGAGKSRVLAGCSLTVSRGESVGLMGNSGSGKSTFARIMAGLERPDFGTIRFCGVDIRKGDTASRNRFRHSVQMLFQDPGSVFHPMRTIERSMDQVLALHQVSKPERCKEVEDVLHRVGLHQEVLSRYPDQISGGQTQRLALARILLLRPRVIILDEPTSGLDISVQAQILHLLKDTQKEMGIAYLLISHDERVIRFMADRSFLLDKGNLTALSSG